MVQQNRGSIVCPSCGKLISANTEACIHCGRKNPGRLKLMEKYYHLLGLHRGLISNIVTACVAIYVISLLIDPMAIFQTRGMFNLFSPSGKAISILGATGTHYVLTWGRWWTVFTAIYLHGNLLHILFNVLWIRQMGVMVEDLFGTSRTFIIFTFSGVLGFVFSILAGIPATLGASGAIFGLFGALVFYGRKRGGYFGQAIFQQVGKWALILFVMGFLWPNVDNFAHAGGFVGGYLSAMFLGFQEYTFERPWHRYTATGLAIFTGIAFVLSVLTLVLAGVV